MSGLRVGLALAILAVAGLPACGPVDARRNDSPDSESIPIPIRMAAVPVTRENLAVTVVGTGTMAAHKTSNIGARVDGIIDKLFVEVGSSVAAGDRLFRTRQVDYEIRVRQAEQSLRLARAEREKARRDLRRVRPLHHSGAASDRHLDDAKTALEIAEARTGSAEAALARARQDLEDTIVTAPYAGVITAKYFDEGSMLSTRGGSSPVVQIMKTDIVVAIVHIPESHLTQIRVGTRGRLEIDGVDGALSSVVAVVNDRVDPQSRAFEVRLPVVNPDTAIKPGLFVRAELSPEPRPGTVVPRSAVLGAGSNRYVFVAEDGLAVRRDVSVRELDAERLEVLRGVSAGEHVLTGPRLAFLRPGEAVSVEPIHANR